MQKRRLTLALLASLALAAIVAGCGGGSSSTDGSTADGGDTPLTKAQFVSQGDAICKKDDAKLNKEVEAFAKEEGLDTEKEPSDDQQTQLVEELLIPNLKDEHDQIADLTPPKGDEDTVEKLLANLEGGIEEAEDDPSSIGEGDTGTKLEKAGKEASDYGFKACGGGE